MKQVYEARNPTEAHIVRGLLEAENIICEVQGELLWGARGALAMDSGTAPSVWILDDTDFEQARSIIKEYENRPKAEDTDVDIWKCTSCGEELEGQFLKCWNCGVEKPAG